MGLRLNRFLCYDFICKVKMVRKKTTSCLSKPKRRKGVITIQIEIDNSPKKRLFLTPMKVSTPKRAWCYSPRTPLFMNIQLASDLLEMVQNAIPVNLVK